MKSGSVREGRQAFFAREAQLLALLVVRPGHRLGQRAHAQDVALALGHADRTARIQQVEGVAGLHHLLVGRQRQVHFHQLLRLTLAGVETVEHFFHVGVFEVVGALLHLVLVVDVTVGHRLAVRAVGPDQVVDVVAVLQVHAQALETVGDLAQHRAAFQATGLLEVGELGHFHAIEPDFPAQAPRAQRRRFPVVLDEAQVVHQRVDAQCLQRIQVQLLDVVRRRLHRHLVLVVALQAVRVLTVTAIGRAPRRLHVGRIPAFRTDRTQEGGRVEGTGAHLQVERLDEHAALLGPELVQGLDQALEGDRNGRGRGHAYKSWPARGALV